MNPILSHTIFEKVKNVLAQHCKRTRVKNNNIVLLKEKH